MAAPHAHCAAHLPVTARSREQRPTAPCPLPHATRADQDIEAIIRKGEKETVDLNQKMQQFTENAMQFTMDGGMVYDFKVPRPWPACPAPPPALPC
jgi:flagellar basal body rod protein FlgB